MISITMDSIKNYSNATVCKLKDRRVSVIKDSGTEDLYLEFKILTDKESVNIPSANHGVIRDRARVTTVRISKEGATALLLALSCQLKLKLS